MAQACANARKPRFQAHFASSGGSSMREAITQIVQLLIDHPDFTHEALPISIAVLPIASSDRTSFNGC
jgi:hypothetical protein